MKVSVQTPKIKKTLIEERVEALELELKRQTEKFAEFSLSMSKTLNEHRTEIVRLREVLAHEQKLRHSRQQNALKEMNE